MPLHPKVFQDQLPLSLPASDQIEFAYSLKLPDAADGYLIQTYFIEEGKKEKKGSRRYIKVGDLAQYNYFTPAEEKQLF